MSLGCYYTTSVATCCAFQTRRRGAYNMSCHIHDCVFQSGALGLVYQLHVVFVRGRRSPSAILLYLSMQLLASQDMVIGASRMSSWEMVRL